MNRSMDDILTELSTMRDRLEEISGSLSDGVRAQDVGRAVELAEAIEEAAYSVTQTLDGDGIEEIGPGACRAEGSDALGVAFQARFRAELGDTAPEWPGIHAERLSARILEMLSEEVGVGAPASHQAYVYREGVDPNDAYIGIQIPMGLIVSEVDELADE